MHECVGSFSGEDLGDAGFDCGAGEVDFVKAGLSLGGAGRLHIDCDNPGDAGVLLEDPHEIGAQKRCCACNNHDFAGGARALNRMIPCAIFGEGPRFEVALL